MRRLCEKKQEYSESLEFFHQKTVTSLFLKQLTNNIIAQARTWKNKFNPLEKPSPARKNSTHNSKLVWHTSFLKLLNISNEQRSFNHQPWSLLNDPLPWVAWLPIR